MRSKSARRGEQERCLELERLGLECKRHLVNGASECAGGWAAGWLGRWRTVLRTRRRLEIERGGYSETGLGAKEDLKQAGWEARCERVALWPALGAARHGHTKPCCWNWSETVRDAPSDSRNTTPGPGGCGPDTGDRGAGRGSRPGRAAQGLRRQRRGRRSCRPAGAATLAKVTERAGLGRRR